MLQNGHFVRMGRAKWPRVATLPGIVAVKSKQIYINVRNLLQSIIKPPNIKME